MRIVSQLLGLALLCPALFGEILPSTPLAPATLEELGRISVPAFALERHEPPRRRTVYAAENAIAATVVPVPLAGPAAPPITRGFQDVTANTPGVMLGAQPADASGAVGPQHVIGAYNNSVVVHDRNGRQLALVSAAQFWVDPTVFPFGANAYDPRVAYDAVNNRWVMAALADDGSLHDGFLCVAMTAGGDPAGIWRRFRVPVDTTGHLAGDFTRLALTGDQIVITVNEYDGDSSTGVNVYTINKAAAYAATSSLPVNRKHAFQMDWTPINTSDSTVLLASGYSPFVTTFELKGDSIVNPKGYSATSTHMPVADCVELGSAAPIDCGPPDLHYGLMRDGSTWLVQGSEVLFIWKIRGNAAMVYQIDAGGNAAAYPSIAVNKVGAALIGYTILSPSIYRSAAYTYIDPYGEVSASTTLKSGEMRYEGLRWGDYTSTVVDPVDDLSFWTLQLYSATLPLHRPWATWWSYMKIAPSQPHRRSVRH